MAKHTFSDQLETDNPAAGNPPGPTSLALEALTWDEIQEYAPQPERRGGGNRRSSGWWAFMYGNFRPRRRSSRREVDQHHPWFDWHEPRILYLSLCVLLLSCIDALFTLNLLQIGATEANVIMASMLAKGVDMFLAVKIGLTAFSVLILASAARCNFFRFISVEQLMKFVCVGYILVIYYEVYLFTFIFEGNLFSNLLYTG